MPCLSSPSFASENLALQRLSAGPFHSIPSALLQRGSACSLKIAVDGIQLTSKAARFRVASQSTDLSTGMDRIRAAKDNVGRTLDSFARSWDDKYFHSSIAHFTTFASQLVSRMDSLRTLRDLPFHKLQSGSATKIRQRGKILDIATAICIHANCVLGFLNQHRVHSLMKGLCRTTNSCKAGLVVGVLRIACSGLCIAEEHPGCLIGARLLAALQSMSYPVGLLSFPQAWHRRIYISHLQQSSMVYCSKLPFEVKGSAFLCPSH